MHRTEPTSLQNMALQLAEKLGSLVENNERVFDLKQGVYGGYFNRGEFIQHAICIMYVGVLFGSTLSLMTIYVKALYECVECFCVVIIAKQ